MLATFYFSPQPPLFLQDIPDTLVYFKELQNQEFRIFFAFSLINHYFCLLLHKLIQLYMNNRILALLLAIVFTTSLYANNKMSAYTRLILNTYHKSNTIDAQQLRRNGLLSVVSKDNNDTPVVSAIIQLNKSAEIPAEELATEGVTIEANIGDFITVTLPIDAFDNISQIEAVKSITLAKPVSTYNNAARKSIGVESIHAGEDLPKAFNGEGVIVGIVDSGIDYNHINFKDENGNTRIIYAGNYDPYSDAYIINSDQEKISKLKTDNTEGSHGTHVAGIAAGSYSKNGYQGMAPKSDLVMFGLENQLYDAHIINGIFWTFNQADALNKPAVVNVSIGSTIGPHDATSYFNQIVDDMCGEGRIVAVATGNNGHENIHINKTFSSPSTTTAQAATVVSYSGGSYSSMLDIWSNNSTPIGTQFFIYDRMSGNEVYSSEIYQPTGEEYQEYIWTSKDSINVAKYFRGIIGFGTEINQYNNKYNTLALISGSTTSNGYRVGIKFYGQKDTQMNCWAYPTPTSLTNMGKTDYTTGSSNGSYNDMACGKNVISVGSYNTMMEFTGIGADGTTGTAVEKFNYNASGKVGEISYFSSYGTDLTGRVHPDICAPGFSLVSSVNGYDKTTVSDGYSSLIDEVITPERNYHWGDMMGTSMATPVVTGTIALWLQANPYLTPEQIRNIMQETAIQDSYTEAKPDMAGGGKLNAKAGLIKVLQSSAITQTNGMSLEKDIVMLYPNPSNGKFSIYVHNTKSNITTNIYNLNGGIVYSNTTSPDNGIINIDASSTLTPGVYIVNVSGDNINNSSRIIVK